VFSNLRRSQVLVYGALAIALLLVGVRAVRSEADGSAQTSDSGFQASTGAGGSGGNSSGGFELASGGPDVVVDVTGAVRRPGVYRLPVGARVTDAVERAGGADRRAALEAINLAARVSDGQQVLVPELGPGGAAAVPAGAAAEDGPISLGSASVEQLETIDGIGPVTAADIIGFRDELDRVPGIGPATMEALRARLQP
jgi:competence protein ComEA